MRVTFIVEGDLGFSVTRQIGEREMFLFDDLVLELLDWKPGRVLVVGERSDRTYVSRHTVVQKDTDTFRVTHEAVDFERSPFTITYARQSPYLTYIDLPAHRQQEFLLPVRMIGEGLDDFTQMVAVEYGNAGWVGGFTMKAMVPRSELRPCKAE